MKKILFCTLPDIKVTYKGAAKYFASEIAGFEYKCKDTALNKDVELSVSEILLENYNVGSTSYTAKGIESKNTNYTVVPTIIEGGYAEVSSDGIVLTGKLLKEVVKKYDGSSKVVQTSGTYNGINGLKLTIEWDSGEYILTGNFIAGEYEIRLLNPRVTGESNYYELNASVLEEILLWIYELRGNKNEE